LNFLRIGIDAAAALTTVSPTYAKEICSREQGQGLEGAIAARASVLTGIVNGVDYSIWSPDRDRFIGTRFDARDLAPKRALKRSLCQELGLVIDDEAPVISVVSRLDPQKGIDLLTGALPGILRAADAGVIVHGAGRPAIASRVAQLARKHKRRMSFVQGYDEALAHRIVAGSDVLLMPSRYEPCGLMQLYAQRYGTIPVARATGGLIDTIEPVTPSSGTGVLFDKASARHLRRAVLGTLALFRDRPHWARIVNNAMRADYSWTKPVLAYEKVYKAVCRRE
jgi:starch synthase